MKQFAIQCHNLLYFNTSMANITIHLNSEDRDIKEKLRALRKIDSRDNPYLDRSESIAAKMLLKGALEKELTRLMKTTGEVKNG